MVATRIATTSTRDLQPLGTGGQLTIDAAGVLFALLTRELTPMHAELFAEPHANSERGEVDWYAEGTGPAEPLSRLPPEQAAPVQAEFDRLSGDIHALVARLHHATRESDRFLAEILDRALRLPYADAVRSRNGRPVLVGWGHEVIGPLQGAVPVLGRARQAPPPMTILPPPVLPPPAGRRLWPWLMALAACFILLGFAGWLLLVPPTVAGPGVCRTADGDLDALSAWRNADAQNATLRAQFAGLVDDAGRRRLQCPPVAQAAAPSVDLSRAVQRGGHSGKLEIILAWNDRNDLDLHVFCPDTTHLFYQNRQACGGELDVDANADEPQVTTTPVEHMFWADPPPGIYRVVVDPYKMREGASSVFRITIRQEGRQDRVQEDTALASQGAKQVLEVKVAPP
jgi:hypothetical protein